MGEGGGTFFEELASKRYPPPVREAINKLAFIDAHSMYVFGGSLKGFYELDDEHRPVLGTDLRVRFGHEFGAGAGLSPSLVELEPKPNFSELVQKLGPELQGLIKQMGL